MLPLNFVCDELFADRAVIEDLRGQGTGGFEIVDPALLRAYTSGLLPSVTDDAGRVRRLVDGNHPIHPSVNGIRVVRSTAQQKLDLPL